MKILLGILTSLSLIGLSCKKPIPEKAPYGALEIAKRSRTTLVWVTSRNGLNLRQNPALTEPIMAVIPYGSIVQVKGVRNNHSNIDDVRGHWMEIIWKEKIGVVFSHYLSVGSEDEYVPLIGARFDQGLNCTDETYSEFGASIIFLPDKKYEGRFGGWTPDHCEEWRSANGNVSMQGFDVSLRPLDATSTFKGENCPRKGSSIRTTSKFQLSDGANYKFVDCNGKLALRNPDHPKSAYVIVNKK